jgi:hypothetical protein
VSPLAFAGESHGKDDWGHKSRKADHGTTQVNSATEDSKGIVNVADNNVVVPINALNCNDVDLGLINVPLDHNVVPLTGALGLFAEQQVKSKTYVDNSCTNSQGATSVDTVSQSNTD